MMMTSIDLTICRAIHPVTSEVLRKAFRSVGELAHVDVKPPESTPDGDTVVSATVSFYDQAAAQTAMETLQGRAIYPQACYLQLTLRQAAPVAPAMAAAVAPAPAGFFYAPAHHAAFYHHHHHHHAAAAIPAALFRPTAQPAPITATQWMLAAGPASAATVVPFSSAISPFVAAHHHYQHQHQHHTAAPQPFHHHQLHHATPHQQQQQHQHQQPVAPVNSHVVLISNVPTNIALKKLFILLEVYGICVGLRRQTRNPETVVAKYETLNDACTAVKLLDGAPFFGKNLHLRQFVGYEDRGSFAPAAGHPSDPNDPACLTADFTVARHRGRPHGHGGVTGRKYPPAENLFVANLTEDMADVDILNDLFVQHGFTVTEFVRKDPSYGIVGLKDADEGVRALIQLHSIIYKERYIRITFSGFPAHQLTQEERALRAAQMHAHKRTAAQTRNDPPPPSAMIAAPGPARVVLGPTPGAAPPAFVPQATIVMDAHHHQNQNQSEQEQQPQLKYDVTSSKAIQVKVEAELEVKQE